MTFDTRSGREGAQYEFYRLPKLLLEDATFQDLSLSAKVLYALLLDRMSLSAKNRWVDKENQVYIYYSIESIMHIFQCRNQKAVHMLQELEKVGLIKKVRQGQGRPTRIYVQSFLEASWKTQKCEKHISENVEITPLKVCASHTNQTE